MLIHKRLKGYYFILFLKVHVEQITIYFGKQNRNIRIENNTGNIKVNRGNVGIENKAVPLASC